MKSSFRRSSLRRTQSGSAGIRRSISGKKRDDRTVYHYNKEWVDSTINSSHFHRQSGHSNEGSQKHFHDGSDKAKHVELGAFSLSPKLIDQIHNEDKYQLDSMVGSDTQPRGTVSDGVFYTGDPANPQIGDERVEVFMVGPQQNVTVMATQAGNSFRGYETKTGITKEILYGGLLSKPEVISKQRVAAAMRRWAFRGGGFIFMWIGLALVLSPIKAMLSFIPFAGRLLDGAIGLVTFLLAMLLSLAVIAVAWFAVRPLLSIGLLVAAVALFFVLYRQKSQSPPPVPAGPPPLPSGA